jgi:hypothetical protein
MKTADLLDRYIRESAGKFLQDSGVYLSEAELDAIGKELIEYMCDMFQIVQEAPSCNCGRMEFAGFSEDKEETIFAHSSK